MKAVSNGMVNLLAGYQFFVAELYTFTLASGDIYLWCAGDGDILINGELRTLSLPNTGAGIAAGSIDPNYAFSVIQGTATGTGGFACVPSSGNYVVADNATAKYLTPSADGTLSYDNGAVDGIYNHRLSFDLTGFDLSSVHIACSVLYDDRIACYLNGVLVGAGTMNPVVLNLTTGVVQEINTLDFEVTNQAAGGASFNPTALLVEFTTVAATMAQYTFTMMAIERDDITHTTGLSVDECKVTLYCKDIAVFGSQTAQAFALMGGLDNAHLKIELAIMPTYGDVSNGLIHLFDGNVTDTTIDFSKVELTISSITMRADTQIPTMVYQPTCTHSLYDGGCKLDKTAWRVGESVVGMDGNNILFNCILATGWFNLGHLTFLTGLNAGLSRTVRAYTLATPAIIELAQYFPFVPQVGDTFVLYTGCDKLRATCKNKFNNEIHFLGWEYMPVPETSV